MKSSLAWLVICFFLQSCVFHVNTSSPPKNGKAVHYHILTKQIESEGKYRRSAKTGEWKYYRTDGTLLKVEHFEKGLLHGKFTSYNPDGTVIATGNYKGGKFIGEWVSYYPGGKLRTKQQFVETEEGAFAEQYFNEKTGKMQYEIHYANFKKYGPYKEWYADKPEQLLVEGAYKVGVKDSVWKSWSKDGSLIYQEYYSYGAKEGLQSYYYENGKIKATQIFANDRLNGLSQEWHDNGKLRFSGYYAAGKRDSLHTYWNKTGHKSTETSYKAGKKHGAEKSYNDAGVLIKQVNYENGIMNGAHEIWHENGKLFNEFSYVNGKEEGDYVAYYPDGKLMEKGVYKTGQKSGKWQMFSENGKLWTEEIYENEMLAREIIYYPNGKKEKENIYKNGSLEESYSYTKSGKRTKNILVKEVEEKMELQDIDVSGPPPIYDYYEVKPPEEQVFMYVEQMPEFPGGLAAMNKFLNDNLVYPKIAKDNYIQGRVYIEFIVRKDGSLTDFSVKKGIGHGCDEEAIRLIKSMPKWQPGKQNGKAVDVKYVMPVKFVLE